ncbi:bifunctional precorrin-2 dehydrogenase/sirohydrochlorin ferrochelatase [Brevibacillus sp. TJ4]|uniref:precorrin-2 dehydrogenase/sirohydrochlorin ferrochelatase family protein n=1 Tax=Brevibacillus sp. TJ4 TaxID=3234853 RepID=UPI0037CE9FF2
MGYYPMYVRLTDKPCLVVGGGKVAQRKIAGLLAAGASVTVVSPEGTASVEEWSRSGAIFWQRRPFLPQDVQGMVVVVAATSDPAVNLIVYEATLPQQWVNIADRPDLCSFVVPAVVTRGDLQVAISTGGHNPGLAKKLRAELEDWLGTEYEDYTLFLGKMRRRLLSLDLDEEEKRSILSALLDERFYNWTKSGEIERRDVEAEKLFTRPLSP